MRHVVGYHNPDTMGYDAENSDPSGLLANKKSIPEEWMGAVMWIITKKKTEKPQRYFLSSWFIIDSIGTCLAWVPDCMYTTAGL